MTKKLLRKGKRGHKDAEVNLKEGLSEREKQNLIECCEPHHWIAKIISENQKKDEES